MSERTFYWYPFNHTYGPWYEMKEVKRGVSVDLTHAGHAVTVQVIPDMDREGWFWSVKFHAYRPKLAVQREKPPKEGEKQPKPKIPLPEKRLGGKAATKEKAMELAKQAFLTGRPSTITAT